MRKQDFNEIENYILQGNFNFDRRVELEQGCVSLNIYTGDRNWTGIYDMTKSSTSAGVYKIRDGKYSQYLIGLYIVNSYIKGSFRNAVRIVVYEARTLYHIYSKSYTIIKWNDMIKERNGFSGLYVVKLNNKMYLKPTKATATAFNSERGPHYGRFGLLMFEGFNVNLYTNSTTYDAFLVAQELIDYMKIYKFGTELLDPTLTSIYEANCLSVEISKSKSIVIDSKNDSNVRSAMMYAAVIDEYRTISYNIQKFVNKYDTNILEEAVNTFIRSKYKNSYQGHSIKKSKLIVDTCIRRYYD